MPRTKKLQVTNPGLIGSRVIKNEAGLKKEQFADGDFVFVGIV